MVIGYDKRAQERGSVTDLDRPRHANLRKDTMAGEHFSRESTVAADSSRSWSVLTNVDTLVSWVSIVHDIHEVAHLEKYTATLVDKVGPIKLKAPLEVDVDVLVEGESIRITAQGTDLQVNSQISVNATLTLGPRDGEGTTVAVDGDYAVLGKVASMGSGIIVKKANKIIDEFFTAMEGELGSA
jgi:uncharacterized protein